MLKSTIAFLTAVSFGLQATAQHAPVINVHHFYKPEENPIVKADSAYSFKDPISQQTVQWQKADVFNPAAIVKDDKVYLLYRCEDNPAAHLGGRTSRLGLAVSDDGIHFTKFPEPVLYPANDSFKKFEHPGGCEDPRLVQTEAGTYVVTYTAWNYDVPRLSIAFSADLIHWDKKGPAFLKAYQGRFADMATKSGSIITRWINGKPVAAKINGKYWMYWGEHIINLAWSENLYDWHPLLDSTGALLAVVKTRPGLFDSDLTECGPPAIITDKGVELFYNGKNATDNRADPKLPKGMYAVGRVIFDVHHLEKVIGRLDEPFLQPSLPHEITGQYKAGTTFAEALVYFKNKWFLYYGTADSFVGVAVTVK
jgi:beta-1,2-mannosidase